jgi:FkbM family methyltransferase
MLQERMKGFLLPRGALVRLIDKLAPASFARRLQSRTRGARLLRPVANFFAPNEPTMVTVRSGPAKGFRLLIDVKTEKYYWSGTHEREVQEALGRLLSPGMTFLDVGAHIGLFSLLASRLVGSSGRVHAIEPMADARERLLASIAANHRENITVHDCALAAETKETMLHAHGSSTTSSIVWESSEGRGQLVAAYTLTEFAERIQTPDVIKIDVEGAEVDVLAGGLAVLAARKPIIVVEFSSGDALRRARKLLPFYEFDALTSEHWVLKPT